jgi:hypothetical protein
MIFSLRAKVFILMVCIIITQRSFASVDTKSNTKIEDKPQVPLLDGVSTRLIPEQSQTITYPETYFSFGVYREFLAHETRDNYDSTGVGVMLGFAQHIRGMWSGEVELRWSDWKAKTDASVADTSPLSIYSKVVAAPDLRNLIKNQNIAEMLRPYATGGLGYTLFFDERSLLAARSKTAFGQQSATYGGGIRIVFPTSFSIKIGAEEWRGLQTSSYFANIMFIEFSFGDVNKF